MTKYSGKCSWINWFFFSLSGLFLEWGGGALGIVADMRDHNIITSEFKLQSCYYVHFQIKPFWERHELKKYHYKDGFGIK